MIYVLFIYAIIKMYISLNIYQQSHYSIKGYIKYFFKNIVFYDLSIILSLILGLYTKELVFKIIASVYILLYSLLYLLVKVKLKFTKRIIRVSIISLVYIFLLSLIKYVGSYLIVLIEFSIIPIYYLDIYVSYLFNRKYIKNAKEKINSYNGVKIGITGSYGKTSTKLLFDQILNVYSNSISSPKSYNTPLGISKFINDNIISVYDYLVLEYGASKVNDISDLLSISSPDVAVITEIGYMHMEGFKTIDDVLFEKMKLTKNARVVILNYDNELIRNYPIEAENLLTYGLSHGDYNARYITNGSFDFYYNDTLLEHFDTNLGGKHQILNLLSTLAYVHYLGFDLSKLKRAVKLLKTASNRLEIKKYKNRTVLDDSFNSNLKGFIEALRLLSTYDTKKILITPGIVELGNYKKKVYEELVPHIISSCDVVILVGYSECQMLYNMLKAYNIELYIVNDFNEGYLLYTSMANKLSDSTLLIENDLPDIYKRR